MNQMAFFLFLITVRVSAEGCVGGLPVKLNMRLMRLVAARLMTNAYASWQSKFSAHTKKCELHTTSVSFCPWLSLFPHSECCNRWLFSPVTVTAEAVKLDRGFFQRLSFLM